MTFLSPSRHTRLNEAVGLLLFLLGLAVSLSLRSYSSTDPSWDTATGSRTLTIFLGLSARNGPICCFRFLASASFLLPVHIWVARLEMGAVFAD